MSVREEYEKLRKKYNLPQFDELDHAFDIADLETDGPLLREIRHRVEERLEFVINTLDPVYPPGSLIAIVFVGFVLLLRLIVLILDSMQKREYSANIRKE